MKKKLLLILTVTLGIAILISPRLPITTTTEHKENWYGPTTWSPDGEQVAYFKRYLEYTTTKPIIDLFIAEETVKTRLIKDQLFLALNDKSGKSETIIKEIKYSTPNESTIIPTLYSAVLWHGNELIFGTGIRDVFTTGVNKINLNNNTETLINPNFSDVAKLGQETTNTTHNNIELYSSPGKYGFISNRVIYIFDHNRRNVKIYISDPLNKNTPYIPPYKVTEK